jgi:hypothetical protein
MQTRAPWGVKEFNERLTEWSGAKFVVNGPGAPGGIALIIGGLGEEEERANAELIARAGNNAWVFKPAVGAALRQLVIDHMRSADHTEVWEDILTGDTVTIEQLLALVLSLPGGGTASGKKS